MVAVKPQILVDWDGDGTFGHSSADITADVLRLIGSDHELFPYVRYEWLDTQVAVPEGVAANPATDRRAILMGASWRPVPQVAVKADYQIHTNGADTGRNEFALVLSYLF